MSLRPPEPLAAHHRVDAFACGVRELDDWIRDHALAAHRGGSARVYVATLGDGVTAAGYYALAAAGVTPADAPDRARSGQPATRPIPAMLLARLAVDQAYQGRGVGQALLRDALLRSVTAADVIGARLFVVHATNAAASTWYRRFGFSESPTDPLHLALLLKDVRATLG